MQRATRTDYFRLLLPQCYSSLTNLQHCQLSRSTTQFSRHSQSTSPLICLAAVPGMQAPAAGPEGEGGLPACGNLPQSVRRHTCPCYVELCTPPPHHRACLARGISLSMTHVGLSHASGNEILVRSVTDTQPDFNEFCKVGHGQDRMMEAASLSAIGAGGVAVFHRQGFQY